MVLTMINVLFVIRYGTRVFDVPSTAVVAFLAMTVALVTALYRLPDRMFSDRLFWTASAVCCLAILVGFAWIPQESLRVDRYEMIRLFWDNLLDGVNPYTRRPDGGNIPGPFPVYFYLAFPFYLIGELGLYALSGFVLFIGLLYRYVRDVRTRLSVLALLVASPAFAWEMIARSTLIVNSVLVLGFILFVYGRDDTAERRIAGSAVLFGLLLSTRSIMLIALAPAIPWYIDQGVGIRRLLTWGIIAAVVFLMTFSPMLGFDSFLHGGLNPFQVQAKFFPTWFPILVLTGCIAYAALRPGFRSHMITASVGMTVLTAGYVLMEAADHGMRDVLFADRADISYLLLVFPFVLFSMIDENALSFPTGR